MTQALHRSSTNMSSKVVSDSVKIFQAALGAADPKAAVRRVLAVDHATQKLSVGGFSYDLKEKFKKVFVVGGGKAVIPMAEAVEEVLGDVLQCGHVVTKDGHAQGTALTKITVTEGSHPVPNEAGVKGTETIVSLLKEASADTLVVALISGGASSLLCAPADGLTLQDKQKTTQVLLSCGATINELNTVRKHLSKIKGGRLAVAAQPATTVALVLSDVVGDPLHVIASGPTVADKSTGLDCLAIIDKYRLQGSVPEAVLKHLEREKDAACAPDVPSTRNVIIGSNQLAVERAEREAKMLGYNTLVLTTRLEGEAREVAKVMASVAQEIMANNRPVPIPACIVAGGETTVCIRGHGKGGRNQELALAAALELEGLPAEVAVLSAGTDGTDGPTDAAGAVATPSTVRIGMDKGFVAARYLDNNDSYAFFNGIQDGHIMTGPTGTNVMDIVVVLVGAPEAGLPS